MISGTICYLLVLTSIWTFPNIWLSMGSLLVAAGVNGLKNMGQEN